jgi:acyl-CoA reductase-like NAD-dependent aldehyde dehydrogenase
MEIEHLVLGGERVPAAEGKTFAVVEPGSGKPFAAVAEAGTEDVERAMRVAYRAFEEGRWTRLSATDRGRILLQAATLLRQQLEDFAVIEARNAGKLGRSSKQDLR